jgi:hypothetical protein
MIEWKYQEDYAGRIEMWVDGKPCMCFADIRQSSMGMLTSSRNLAKRIVAWLNAQPQSDTVLSPFEDRAEDVPNY